MTNINYTEKENVVHLFIYSSLIPQKPEVNKTDLRHLVASCLQQKKINDQKVKNKIHKVLISSCQTSKE
jgi:hypothetical protein